ncbi:MAG: hypothetical protein ABI241_00525 [Bacteroidia bacterium]
MQEIANEIARNYLLNEENKTIYVTMPDRAVYLNSDKDVVQAHCDANKLTLIVIKDSEKEAIKQVENEEEETENIKPVFKTKKK